MNLYYSILVAIWLAVVYAIWAATAAGDPGFGQAAFLGGGILATLYLRKPIEKSYGFLIYLLCFQSAFF
jgi:hypothetical protein